MFTFNGYLKELSPMFKKTQTHWDGLDLEAEIYTDFIYNAIELYSTTRFSFFNKIDETLFEFGTTASRTAFYTYVMFAEQYVNLLNPRFGTKFFVDFIKILFYIKKVDICFNESEQFNKEIIKLCVNGMSYIEQDFKSHDGKFYLDNLKKLQITGHSEHIERIDKFFFDFINREQLQTFRLDMTDGKHEIVLLNPQIFFPPVYVESIVIPRNHPDTHDVETTSLETFMWTFQSENKKDKIERLAKIINSNTDVLLSSFARRDMDNDSKRRMLH